LKPKPSIQALSLLIIIGTLLLSATVLSLYLNLNRTRQQYEEVATEVGRSIFKEFLVIRRWNSQHDGVYVPVTETFQPNPYLQDLSRDITTIDGRKFTKINPEYMTRLISDLLTQKKGTKIHITSLKLTNIANKADEWENNALEKFETGSNEEFSIIGSDRSAIFRYMAPLKTEGSCLNCHGKQGYKIGDIRGGLSISFSYAPFQKAVSKNNRQIFSLHILFLLIGITVIYFLGKRLIIRIKELQEALLHIKRLEGFLPICAHCKRIRMEAADAKEQKSWVPLETYIQDKTDAEFTHGLCPECLKELYDFEYDK
jgi:hypothetical protein